MTAKVQLQEKKERNKSLVLNLKGLRAKTKCFVVYRQSDSVDWLFSCETLAIRQRHKPEIRKVSILDNRNRATTR
jgi:hypothetical protein